MNAGRHRLCLVARWAAWMGSLAAFATLAAPAAGHAQDRSLTAPEPGRVLVLVVAVDAVNAPTADALTELLVGAVAGRDPGRAIVGKEELQAQLGQSDAATLECVGSPLCLGRLAVQLDLDRVVAASLARRPERWVFDLHRLDARTGESLRHAFRDVRGDEGALADALLAAFSELDEEQVEPATLTVAVDTLGARVWVDGKELGTFRGEALQRADLPAGSHRIEVRAEGRESWTRHVALHPGENVRVEAGLVPLPVVVLAVPPPPAPSPAPRWRWSPVLWVGVGVSVAAVALAVGFGSASRRQLHGPTNRAEAIAFVEDRERQARVARVSWSVVAAGVGVAGLGLWLSRPVSESSAVALRGEWGGLSLDLEHRW